MRTAGFEFVSPGRPHPEVRPGADATIKTGEAAPGASLSARRRVTFAAMTVALLAFLPGCYLFQSSETFYGLQTAGAKVVFVIDISGSMEGKNEGTLADRAVGVAAQTGSNAVSGLVGGPLGSLIGQQASSEITKLGGAKRELIPALQGLPESSSFTIITFGNDAKPWFRGMVTASSDNKNLGLVFVKQLEANGGTPARQALQAAFNYPDASLIFFLSDGQPTDAGPDQILAEVRSLNAQRHIPISTVGLGSDQDERFLTALANENGGRYVRK
jgi:uncharacterized protein YegL